MGRGDRGSVAVEAGFIFPVLVLILFGVVEFSMLLRDHVALTAATRSGVRTASALPRDATAGSAAAQAVVSAGTAMPMSTIEELWIYKANTAGYPGANGVTSFASCPTTSCNRYTFDAGTRSFVLAGGSWDYTHVNACVGTAESVGIYVRARHSFVTGLFGVGMDIGDHAVMRFEPIPADQLAAGQSCSG
ncbi:MAG: TadE/TadG family type IV pilus assembly protein [Actinomycetes bacterium]